MLMKRIIPCLDVHEGRVVKGVNFLNLRDAGDPVEIARAYDEQGADELVFLDITASHEGRDITLDMVRRVAEQCFMPFAVGGGIRTIDDVTQLIQAGAEKVSINTAAVIDPDIVAQTAKRFGRCATVVNIDHHVTNSLFGDLNVIDAQASSTSEIIYDLAQALDVEIDYDMAVNLYAGILTDTGSFRYSSTTPRAMSVAGRLLRCGIDPHAIAQEIYENAEFDSLRLLGTILSRLGKTPDGLVSWVSFSHKELSSLSNASETEEFVNFARALNTAVIAIGFKEALPREIRISLRSKGDIDVSSLASQFGGGGHRNAAGCTVKGSLKSVERRLVKAACSFLADQDRPLP